VIGVVGPPRRASWEKARLERIRLHVWRRNLGLVMIAAGPRQGALDLMEHVTITNVGAKMAS
jgi:hypothetical protein